jgi:hypothetical protein
MSQTSPLALSDQSTRRRVGPSPMKRLTLFTCAAVAILSAGAIRAQATEVGNSRNFGLGFQIGEPTAITAKAFLGRGHAMDFGLGFGGWGYGWCRDANGNGYRCDDLNHNLSLHADYLYQDNIVNMTNRLDWYAGFGGRGDHVGVWEQQSRPRCGGHRAHSHRHCRFLLAPWLPGSVPGNRTRHSRLPTGLQYRLWPGRARVLLI